MRAASFAEHDNAWFAQPEDVIALIEDPLPMSRSSHRIFIYGLVALLALAICIGLVV
jgi:hypothetical protein